MKKLSVIFVALFLSGCTLNIGQRLVFMHDKYPEYPVIEEPELQDIAGKELTPYKGIVEYTKKVYEDGKITHEEADNYNKMLEDAKNNASTGKEKIKNNINSIRVWGKKNEATVKIYNDFAKKMNERTFNSE